LNTSESTSDKRFNPKASREMASMFDGVSGRYDLLNRVMTLGQDSAWREAMWQRVPAAAYRVLDLCTGSGVSLQGLCRPGRTVLGMDVSLAMLQVAAADSVPSGWAPRLACADGFRLPLRNGVLDAVTVAFGIRNLRPRAEALAEISRVLAPGGRLVVLEAAAPAPGPLAPFARWWIRHAIPFAGRLSSDPTAYRYLSQSIFEFGSGPEFEADLDAAGFRRVESRSFLFGAARLWVAESSSVLGQNPAVRPLPVRSARRTPGDLAQGDGHPDRAPGEAGVWRLAQAITSLTLSAAFVWALIVWLKVRHDLPLSPPQRFVAWVLIVGGLVVFAVRSAVQFLRWSATRGGGDPRV
jgi:demethylmenaquinone methyltransferase/2-methoxy-6-polyprenyl-1,4-benzoquinol methylase